MVMIWTKYILSQENYLKIWGDSINTVIYHTSCFIMEQQELL